MSQAEGAPDPSMEDILASIRRILHEEPAAETGAEPGLADPAAHDAAGQTVQDVSPSPDVFVLDQSMLIEEPPHVADDFPEDPGPPQAARRDPYDAPSTSAPAGEPLLAPSSAAAASASMGALVRVLGQQQTPVYRGGPTLEDMVREEIRPLVKTWLDEHLPAMVERMVRAEIARVTGGS